MVTMLSCGNEEPEATCTLPEAVNGIPRLTRAEPGVRMAGAACTSKWPCHTSIAHAEAAPPSRASPSNAPGAARLTGQRIQMPPFSPPAGFSSGPRKTFRPISGVDLTPSLWMEGGIY